MKAISEMNLGEIASFLETGEPSAYLLEQRLRELHEQTRWIPVSERLPTEADGKWVRWFIPDERFGGYDDVERPIYPPRNATHWQRITPPEGV